jgi:hypothetical protein
MRVMSLMTLAENKMPHWQHGRNWQLRCGTAAAIVSAKASSMIFPSQVSCIILPRFTYPIVLQACVFLLIK